MNTEQTEELITLLIKSYRGTIQAEGTDFLDTKEESEKLNELLVKYLLYNF